MQRSGDLNPVLAATLITGSPPALALPAMLLSLAERGAIVIEPEREGGLLSKPTIQVRLAEQTALADEFDQTAWTLLQGKANVGAISSKELQKLAGDNALKHLATTHMRQNGWLNPAAVNAKVALAVVSIVGFALAIAAVIIAGVAENWWAMIAPAALGAVAIWAIIAYAVFSNLSRLGQDEAQPWIGYRKGIERAAKDKRAEMDLDAGRGCHKSRSGHQWQVQTSDRRRAATQTFCWIVYCHLCMVASVLRRLCLNQCIDNHRQWRWCGRWWWSGGRYLDQLFGHNPVPDAQ